MIVAARNRHRSSKPPRRWRYALLALLAACLAIAGAVLPMVWDLLASLKQLPKIDWLESLLARSPALSWSLMLAWGTAVSLALMVTLSLQLGWRGAALVAALSLWAIAWYIHMPAIKECPNFYDFSNVCTAWQWVFAISLSIATALYMFAVFLLALCALGLLFTRPGETAADED